MNENGLCWAVYAVSVHEHAIVETLLCWRLTVEEALREAEVHRLRVIGEGYHLVLREMWPMSEATSETAKATS
jgi:hypothetical protein